MKQTRKIKLPEDISEITLEQSKRYIEIANREDIDDVAKTQRIVKLFTGMKFSDIENLHLGDYETITTHIGNAMNKDVDFKNRFILDGVEYGFIPNLNDITTGEYIDLSTHGTSVDNLHKVMAILFRPVISTGMNDTYEIEPYRVDKERQEIMKQAPMNIVNGMMVFFCLLSRELQSHILKSMEENQEEVKKELKDTLVSGDGMSA
tara:strand:+ start:1867 stop:2484 length:618 start_codon:yes stop_codon:yes gene_type:complete